MIARALLVPGNDLPAAFYAGLVAELATRGVALRVEDRPPLPRWSDNAERIAAQVEERDALVGHSLGGLLALLAAARRSPARLILLEPPIAPHKLLARASAEKYRREVVLGRRDVFVNWSGAAHRVFDVAGFPAEARRLYLDCRAGGDVAVLARLFGSLAELYPLPFEKISAPTLLLTAAHSGWRMRALGAWLAVKMNAEHRLVPGCGHFMANEADAALAAAIAGFIRA